jgi:hypothetical protein
MKLNFLPLLQRNYVDYYGNCVETGLDPHVCEPCDDAAPEHANISSGAWIHQDAYAAIAANPTDAATWQAQIDLNLVMILPNLRGTFDGGTPTLGNGFGRKKSEYISSDFKATITDKVYKRNWAHYRSLVGKNTWYFCYVTETQGHISGVPVTVAPKNPITDSVDDIITWQSDVTWTEFFTPAPFDAPLEIFGCVAS